MPTEPESPEEGRKSSLALALSVGWELTSFTLLGVGLGYWLDGRLKSSPWGTLVGALFGIVLGLYRLIRTFSLPKNGGAGRR
ncbi:MAG: AtpZ/AtpI family protein [Elusimicrobia bacterium]|nr:AtpZ/AtpI family protein [Elusimicrobiota bacterium]